MTLAGIAWTVRDFCIISQSRFRSFVETSSAFQSFDSDNKIPFSPNTSPKIPRKTLNSIPCFPPNSFPHSLFFQIPPKTQIKTKSSFCHESSQSPLPLLNSLPNRFRQHQARSPPPSQASDSRIPRKSQHRRRRRRRRGG